MKAIVTVITDHTNVYGYISVEPMTDNGLPVDKTQLPKVVREMCDEQYPSRSHARNHMDEPALLLRKLGWTVLDADGDTYQTPEERVSERDTVLGGYSDEALLAELAKRGVKAD